MDLTRNAGSSFGTAAGHTILARGSNGPEIRPSALDCAPSDRLLVLAPHEDDEVLGAGGLIRRTVQAVEAALRGLAGQIDAPQVLAYGIHHPSWPLARRRQNTRAFGWSQAWGADDPQRAISLTAEDRMLKEQAILCFRSQLRMKREWLLSFAHPEECFATPAPLPTKAFPIALRRRWAKAEKGGAGESGR
jgi:LmbE family N-acetylglucosaminyl deacetylase